MREVPFYRHQLGAPEAAQVAEVLASPFLTTGPKTRLVEAELARFLGVPHAAGVTSATTALFLLLLAAGVGPGDEVITTPMTFIATSNAILHTGATPVFVDVEPHTGNLDVARVEAAITPRTKAVLPVHLYGQMVDVRALLAITEPRGLVVIEDAAHALEATRDGVRPGQLTLGAAFSFYATKNVTSGEGGLVSTAHPEVDAKVRKLRLHGMDASAYDRHTGVYRHWDMTELGYKANLCDVQAALLIPQLPHIDDKRRRRDALARRYDELLAGAPDLTLPRALPGGDHARHLYTVWVEPRRRDEVLGRLQQAGIGVAVNYRAVHLLTYYRERFGFQPGAFPEAERIGASTLSLPLYPTLPEDDLAYVASTLVRILQTPA